MAEAAERRAAQEENRGIKDPNSVKRLEQKQREVEQRQQQHTGGDSPTLRVMIFCFTHYTLYDVHCIMHIV